MKKIILGTILGTFLLVTPLFIFAQEPSGAEEVEVTEKALTMMPCLYLNKNVIITEVVYMDVSPTLLDDPYHDKFTNFKTREYLNFRTIGNEMHHYFMKHKKAEIITTLKEGDKISVRGYVRSCADLQPWDKVDSVVKLPPPAE